MSDPDTIARLYELYAKGSLVAARSLAEQLLDREPPYAEAFQVLGLIAYQENRFADAIDAFRRSLKICPHAATWSNLGAALRAGAQPDEAEDAYRQALRLQPDLLSAERNLANLLLIAGRLADAEPILADASRHHPGVLELRRQLAAVAQTLGNHHAAVRVWREIIDLTPNDVVAVLHLAECLREEGDVSAAEAALHDYLAVHGDNPAILSRLGGVLAGRGQLLAAEQSFARCLTLAPEMAIAWADRSDVLRRLGRPKPAEMAAREALKIDNRLAAAAVNLGNALAEQHRHDDAEAAFDLAISIEPECAEAFNGRGLSRLGRGAPISAEADFREALRVRPTLTVVGTNLGLALLDQGHPAEALAALRTATAANPHVPAARRTMLFSLNYQPDLSAEAIFSEFQKWGATQSRCSPVYAAGAASSGQRLRIGYVSPDFRAKSASFFIGPLLSAHDRNAVEVFCYAEVSSDDATTRELRALADHWRSTIELNDEALADMIRRDRIDVLVDMGGHTTNSRVAVFGYRAAPVQIEYLLGHGATSGLATMDAFVADRWLVPPGSEPLLTEPVVRLDRIPLAYAPPDYLPDVAPLPARARGHVTFGHFGRTARIHDGVIAAWSRILLGTPGSRLILNSPPFSEPALRNHFARRFAECGIEARRLDLIFTYPQQKTFLAYGDIDIGLDPFPHNAGTTTIESLWMGVPVVSLADRPPVGRFGASILHAVGLDFWIAHDLDSYVVRAIDAAADLNELETTRETLRVRCMVSPMNDAVGLARSMEEVYRDFLHFPTRR